MSTESQAAKPDDSKAIPLSEIAPEVARLGKVCQSVPDRRSRRLLAVEADLQALRRELDATSDWTFQPPAWARLTPEQQAQFRDRLAAVTEAIEEAIQADGPDTKTSIMYKEYASNSAIVVLTALAMVALCVVLYSVVRLWPAATDKAPAEEKIFLMIVLMGALGGMLRLTSSFAKFVGNRQLYRSWVVYYLLMPFEGAALAPAVYLLLRVGVLSPGTGSTGQLNVFALYGFAVLTGLFAKNAIDMLADVFSIIFKKVQAKDALPGDAAKSGPPPSASA